ncbi:RrF2 family transcriptional regulator [Blastopirellula marina]|uniref:Transcriptional regulator, Rrf2 n=1 Tax=Blastopirellula marina TaxID=124 RepID=A0A2S8FDB8_9BACT|nr:Rrf2 family transcriptional regulator [Blastopirellula marina]PQO30161.1 transcriptional regulator, Rrf2 [Blastopirellula marina]PQO43212.1 transcriptional regulator, Rrf2 [Blastopirellula marina]PTL42599.1 Rrf2 family transcriptional regulator [Blastopirellula marina]
MKLTTQTDYALRTLMFLATKSERANVADVAQLFGISVHHVAKVVNQLAKFGYVRSVRGVGGGIELARKPDTISIGEIVDRFEGGMQLLDCVDTEDVCAIQSFCKLKGVLAEAERVQRAYLESVTLADVAPGARQLAAAGRQLA